MQKDIVRGTPQPTGVILHIGAGLCPELAEYRAASPTRIVLVEPHPDTLPALRSLVGKHKNEMPVDVVAAAAADETGQALFHMLNLADLSSLCQPGALRELMQGVLIEQSLLVDTLSVTDLLAGIEFESTKTHRLILEAPGMELALLENLSQAGLLQTFTEITVSISAVCLFEGGSDVSQVRAFLDQVGYSLMMCDETTDPDWPRLFMRSDPQARKIAELTELLATQVKAGEAEIKALHEQAARAEQAQKDANARAAAIERDLQAKLAEGDAQRSKLHERATKAEQAQKDANARAATIERDLQAKLAEGDAQRSKLHERATKAEQAQKDANARAATIEQDLQAKLAEGDAQRSKLHERATKAEQAQKDANARAAAIERDLQAKLAEGDAQRSKLHERATKAEQAQKDANARAAAIERDLQAKLAEGDVQLGELESIVPVLRSKLEMAERQRHTAEEKAAEVETTAKRDLAMAVRLQTLLQGDFSDLQERYVAMQSEKRQQEDLLVKLTQKLGSAAGYLRQLSDEEDIAETIEKATPAPRVTRKKTTRTPKTTTRKRSERG